MLGIEQFKKLQELKELGLSKLKVSEKLNLSYKTVWNWWDKDEDFFNTFQKEHEFILDNYRQYIIEILKICPQINNMVLLNRIQEDFPDFEIPPSTFFRYVKKVREQTGLIKPPRKFILREQTEPGYEAQVDFGQYVMQTAYKRNVRIYFFCMTLSYSRMKFAYFSVDPFDAKATIDAHIAAFRYFGGRTQMIMYDQDKTMVVSENLGEVIFVKEYEEFIKDTGFSIYLCKGYDPSTKGKVEKTVDCVKHQFLDGRIYYGLDRLNQEFIDWLNHDGNGMINDTTKKSPRELFKKEYPKLQKYYEKKNDEIVVHAVYHDTVEYRDNLYKLPTGQINESDRIRIERHDDFLIFYLASTNVLLCKHRLVSGIGNIISLDIEVKDEPTIEEVLLTEYKDSESATKFLKRLREQKPRYVFAQCRKIGSLKKFYSRKVLIKGMEYCITKDTCTAFELCSWLLMEIGENIAKKYLPTHTFRHYKNRAEEIRKEMIECGRC